MKENLACLLNGHKSNLDFDWSTEESFPICIYCQRRIVLDWDTVTYVLLKPYKR